MKKIKMHDGKEFDIDMSTIGAVIDSSTKFHKTEQPSLDLLNRILTCKLEMKSHMQTLKTTNLFIEFMIDNKGDGELVQSGLNVTKADMYFLNIDEMGLFLPVRFLKWLLKYRDKLGIETKNNKRTADDHIGYGLIIPMWQLMDLYLKYHNAKTRKRLQQLDINKNKNKK